MTPILELTHVVKRYTGIPVVNDVSFSIQPGIVTGYLGPNGSGKSTTLKLITGLIEPSDGEIRFEGQLIELQSLAYRQRFGYVPEEPHLYPHLSGLEYMEMVGQLRGMDPTVLQRKIDGFLALFSLHADRHSPMSAYSKGMRQKVLISAALLHNPSLILLDEPFTGLDVNAVLILRSLILELCRKGKAILLSSHELEVVERVCERVIILHKGRVVADDSISALRGLMSAPSLEHVFTQLAVEQDAAAIASEMAALVELGA